MSQAKIDELEALLQTPENERDNTITNTGMTAYQQIVERIVAEITGDGVTSGEIENVKGKMLKLPDGETKDLFKKLVDKMEEQHKEEEENKKSDVEEDNQTKSNFDFNLSGLGKFSPSEILAEKIKLCGEYFGNLVEKKFDDNGKEVSDQSEGSMIQVSDVAKAAIAVYEIIDCLKGAGVNVLVSSAQKDFDSSQPLAYAINFPQGFAPRDIYSITSENVAEIIELQKQQSLGNQRRDPNIFMQVIGSEIGQMQQYLREFSANIMMNNISDIRQQLQKLLVNNSNSDEQEDQKFKIWQNFVGQQNKENKGGIQR